MTRFKHRTATLAENLGIELSDAEVSLVSGGTGMDLISSRLQMTMDQRSKLFESLSNMMKTMNQTSSAIIQNMH